MEDGVAGLIVTFTLKRPRPLGAFAFAMRGESPPGTPPWPVDPYGV
jgi:hypothetical protein